MFNSHGILLITFSQDEYNVYVPRGVAEVSLTLKNEINNIMKKSMS